MVGVQAGKTRIAGALADHAALSGEAGTFAVLVAQDHRGAMRTPLRWPANRSKRSTPFALKSCDRPSIRSNCEMASRLPHIPADLPRFAAFAPASP